MNWLPTKGSRTTRCHGSFQIVEGEFSCYGGAFEAVSAKIRSTWKNFWKLNDVLVGK